MTHFTDWGYEGKAAPDNAKVLAELIRVADKYFDGRISFFKSGEDWICMLGAEAGTYLGVQEIEEAPCGKSLMEAVQEALRRVALLSEEG